MFKRFQKRLCKIECKAIPRAYTLNLESCLHHKDSLHFTTNLAAGLLGGVSLQEKILCEHDRGYTSNDFLLWNAYFRFVSWNDTLHGGLLFHPNTLGLHIHILHLFTTHQTFTAVAGQAYLLAPLLLDYKL